MFFKSLKGLLCLKLRIAGIQTQDRKPTKTFFQTAKSLQLQGDPDWSVQIDAR
jgi:hypothetical protein